MLRCSTSHLGNNDSRARYVLMEIVRELPAAEKRSVDMLDALTKGAR